VICTFGIARDITEQKQPEMEFSSKADRIEQCMKEKKDLANECSQLSIFLRKFQAQ